jgi:hypothetical protein
MLTLLATGALAGLTATFLVLGATVQPAYATLLYAASALPIFIVGLGWGNIASLAAIVTAFVFGAASSSTEFALLMTVTTLAPAGWLSHLSSLARPASELGGPDHLTAWYPLSDILLHLCAVITLALVIVGMMIGYGPELAGNLVDVMVTNLQNQEPALVAEAQTLAQTKASLVLVLPVAQGATWVIFLFAAYYFATLIVNASGRAKRPREDMPSALRMNQIGIFVFLAGLAAMFVGGVPAMLGAAVCGAFGAGFLLAGYASLHLRTRGKPWRFPALVLAYLASTFVLPAFFILVLGLVDTRRAVALTPAKNDNSANDSNQ